MIFLRYWLVRAHWGVLLCALVLLAIELCYWGDRMLTWRPANGFGVFRDICLYVAAFQYGAWRVWGWHPAFQDQYRTWLLTTPWDGRRPLPFGPVRLSLNDLLVVGALFAWASFHASLSPAWLPLAALVGYLAVLLVLFRRVRVWRYYYAVALGLGLVARYIPQPFTATLLAIGVYAFAYFGIKQTLRSLPLEEGPFAQGFPWGFGARPIPIRAEAWHGWPHDSLAPARETPSISRFHSLMLSVVAAWCLHVTLSLCVLILIDESGQIAAAHFKQEIREASWLFCVLAGVAVALTRLVLYGIGYRSPINLWGRIFTGRLIIPRYDQFFLAPLCVLALIPCGRKLSNAIGLDGEVSAPLMLFAILWVSFCMGPSLLTFRCATPARLVPYVSSRDPKKFAQI